MSDKEKRELECWIAEHVMGWSYSNFNYCVKATGAFVRCDLPRFTTDRAASQEVLEKCAERGEITFGHPNGHPELWAIASTHRTYSEAETLPLAICLFAQKVFSK